MKENNNMELPELTQDQQDAAALAKAIEVLVRLDPKSFRGRCALRYLTSLAKRFAKS